MIAREPFERYRRALGANADMAEAELSTLWGEHLAGLSGAGLRDAMDELMPALAARYGDRAAAAAAEFYMEQRAASDAPGGYDAVPMAGVDHSAVAAASRAAFAEASTRAALGALLSGQLVRHVNQAADDTIVGNARRDPAHPRWALVPHAGACGFCLLIASRGFDYRSSGRVARHNGCRCTTVADFDRSNPSLEGYDEAAAHDLYSRAAEEVERTAWDEWGALDDGQRAAYRSRGRGDFDAFKRNRISAAMERLRRGGKPGIKGD